MPRLGVVKLITEAIAAFLFLGSLGLVGCLVADELGLRLVQVRCAAFVTDVVVGRLLLGRQVVLATAGLEVAGLKGVAEHRLVLDVLGILMRGGDGCPNEKLGGVRKHDETIDLNSEFYVARKRYEGIDGLVLAGDGSSDDG